VGAPYSMQSTGPKEPDHRAHPPPARSQATYQDLPHIDFSRSAALDARVMPARRAIKRKGPDIAEAESKRQQRVDEEQRFAGLSTMVEGQERFILRFIIGRDGGGEVLRERLRQCEDIEPRGQRNIYTPPRDGQVSSVAVRDNPHSGHRERPRDLCVGDQEMEPLQFSVIWLYW
jgi:hypothetical protein